MLINIPTAESLNDVALRLHFSAWGDLIVMLSDFEVAYEPNENDPNMWSEERAEYLTACQPELQSICTLIQQSNELALKARLCAASPYLLLLRTDPKLSAAISKDVDFTEFKTLDALDLPPAVNTFCAEPISDKFIGTYDLVRSLRNKITHLGSSGKIFEPEGLLHILVIQYTELWAGRAWLQDRVLFASKTRLSFFHDYKYTPPDMEVMHELPFTFRILKKSEFSRLFGAPKSKRRYVCHVCFQNADQQSDH